MALECSCRCELAELVTYHILRNIYGNVLSSVVDSECVSYEIRENC